MKLYKVPPLGHTGEISVYSHVEELNDRYIIPNYSQYGYVDTTTESGFVPTGKFSHVVYKENNKHFFKTHQEAMEKHISNVKSIIQEAKTKMDEFSQELIKFGG